MVLLLKTVIKPINIANVLNLCLGLADDNGNWITMNRVSDPMLKGKTEVELYHGEAEFNKIYTKDISRTFPNGRVNIVIYAKPSILIYDGLTSDYEEHVHAETIEPLVIQEVIIKAKKKYWTHMIKPVWSIPCDPTSSLNSHISDSSKFMHFLH